AAARVRGRSKSGELGESGRPALYFCGSIRGGREDRTLYERIVSRLRRFGTVLTEHVAAAELGARGEALGTRAAGTRAGAWLGWRGPGLIRGSCAPGARSPPSYPGAPSSAPVREGNWPGRGLRGSQQACEWEEAAGGDRLIHERDLAWLQQADVVVAEVTQPSLGVGYELGRAVAFNKRILCLFRPQSGRVLSAMIRGAADGSRFQVWDYEEGEVEALLDRYFEADPPGQVAASPDPPT
uniref:2'-deoxynucleoside 5'-phosphate N-hydrolase 1 n=1 Tax=Cercocebus atys TaxID=9531 RepID=A0A2K5MB24_CERAT